MKIHGIIYTSNTGYTKEYAKLLSEASGLPAYALGESIPLKKGEPIFYLGWLRAGHIVGLPKAQELFSVCGICGVGLTPPDHQADNFRHLYRMPENIGIFYLQGGLNLNRLTGIQKLVMLLVTAMMRSPLQNKKDRTPEEDKMLHVLKKGGSFVSSDALSPILCWLNPETP